MLTLDHLHLARMSHGLHSLEWLADEVLSHILDLQADAVISLWLCGSRALNLRMSRCCRSFRTPPGMEYAYSWPRALSELHGLVSVDFCSLFMRESLETVSLEVRKLPKTLRTLRVGFANAGFLFYSNYDLDKSSGLPLPQLRNLKGSQPRLWDIATHFPVLERLELGPNSRDAYLMLNGPDLAFLPPTLHTLDFHCIVLQDGQFSALPRSLRSLKILRSNPRPEHLAGLPPDLTELSGFQVSSSNQLVLLPSGLKSDVVLSEKAVPRETVPTLPVDLTSLTFAKGTAEALTLPLPSTLTSIDTAAAWTVATISSLPRSVTRIHNFNGSLLLPELRLLPADARDFAWPPLRTLSFLFTRTPSWFPVTEDLAILPRSLTTLAKLDFGLRREDKNESIFFGGAFLPPHLTELSVFKYSRSFRPGSLFDLLPATIRSFLGNPYPVEELPDSTTTALPRSLRTLQILSRFGNAPLSLAELRTIPDTTTELSLQHLDSNLLSVLPRGLVTLHIDQLQGDILETTFKALPPRITSLCTEIINLSTAPPSAFRHLPPTLTSLKLRIVAISAMILENLPLTILQLSASILASTFGITTSPTGSTSPNSRPAQTQSSSSDWPQQEKGGPAELEVLKRIPVRWLRWVVYHRKCDKRLRELIRAVWPKGEMLPKVLREDRSADTTCP